jgi:hypothetical protein
MKSFTQFTVSLLFFISLNEYLSAKSFSDSVPKDTTNSNLETIHGNIMFDPVGFFTFGPTIQVEPAISKNFSIIAGLRLHNLGLIQRLLYGKMNLSYMGHLSFRYYFKPDQRINGFFISPGVEFGRSNYSSGTKYNARAFGGEVGYKWITKKGFCLEISDNIGIIQSKRISDDTYNINNSWNTDAFVFYMLSAKIGKIF